jgi:hypothetical protein
MPVTWNGEQFTAGDLYNQLVFFNVSRDYLPNVGYLNDTTNAGSSIQQLQALYQASLDNGVLTDPAVYTLVTSLSTKLRL